MLFATLFLLLALAGQLLSQRVHSRSRKHGFRSHHQIMQNMTRRNAPQAKVGPMQLQDMYAGQSFFDGFDFFDQADPTHGNVDYLGKQDALQAGLATVDQQNVVTLKVDTNETVPVGRNRKSVRISSIKTYTGGLFIMDVNAMPTGCATWPAFWTVTNAVWPQGGEIDIVEGVNTQSRNQMTLHTAPGCTLDASAPPSNGSSQAFTGTVLSTTCDATANSNSGCGVTDPDSNSFGAGVANGGGAVFAMLWDSIGVRVWHFSRSNTPPDLTAQKPNPSTWPTPSAFWSSSTCSVNQFFGEHVIVVNTALCGDFAGGAYPSSGCPGTCQERVADPNNFHDAQWKINYIATFQ